MTNVREYDEIEEQGGDRASRLHRALDRILDHSMKQNTERTKRLHQAIDRMLDNLEFSQK